MLPERAIHHLLKFSPTLIPTWNESSQGLVVLISIPVGLPPVRIILANNVKDVTLLEGQTQLPARHKGVIRGIVVKVSTYVNLRRGFTTTGLLWHARQQEISRKYVHC